MAIISANLSFNRGAHELLDFSSLQVKYSTALAWAQDANSNAAVGQYIYLQESETINNVVYPKGPYVVEGIGENAYIHYLLGGDGKADADDVYTKEEINAALAKYVTNEVFNNYKQEVTDALAEKLVANDLAEYAKSADVVANDVFNSYKQEVTNALAEKLEAADLAEYAKSADVVANDVFNSFKESVNTTLALKANTADVVANTTFQEYQASMLTALAAKANAADVVTNVDFNTFKTNNQAALDLKANTADVVANTTLETYKGEVTNALAGKVDNSALETYKGEVSGAIDSKVAQDVYDAKVEELGGAIATAQETAAKGVTDAAAAQATANEAKGKIEAFMEAADLTDTAIDTLKEIQEYITTDGAAAQEMLDAIAGKVAQTDYDAKVAELEGAINAKADAEEMTNALAGKVDNSALETYKGEVTNALAGKVDNSALETYKGEVSGALDLKANAADVVANDDFNNYKQEVTDALAEKLVANDLAEYAKSADVVAKEGYVAYSEEEKTKLSNIEEKAQVNVIEKVTLFGNEVVADENKVVAIDFQSDDIKLGVDITTTVTDEETGESSEVVVFGSDKTISETLKGIYSSLQAGLSGGVTSVTAADDSVIVSGDVNNKEVKVRISAAADNRLSVRTVDGEKGLYVEPLYYMGDDSEVE